MKSSNKSPPTSKAFAPPTKSCSTNCPPSKDDLHQIHAEQARLAANAIGRDDLKPLALKIEEVDERRQEDKEAI